jgi:hypothetical protein
MSKIVKPIEIKKQFEIIKPIEIITSNELIKLGEAIKLIRPDSVSINRYTQYNCNDPINSNVPGCSNISKSCCNTNGPQCPSGIIVNDYDENGNLIAKYKYDCKDIRCPQCVYN